MNFSLLHTGLHLIVTYGSQLYELTVTDTECRCNTAITHVTRALPTRTPLDMRHVVRKDENLVLDIDYYRRKLNELRSS